MTKTTITTLALAVALTFGSGIAAFAQGDSGALVDVLVRKKILTAQEGEDVRADLIKENASTTAGKLNFSNSITELKIYGDVRLREQYDNVDPQVEPPQSFVKGSTGTGNPQHGVQQDRFRFRLRLNADFKLAGNFFGGVQLQTNQASDSGNQTFGDTKSNAGAFGNYGVYISRAFFGWQQADWGLTLIAGKQPNPFYTTDLVWDADINPDGITESWAIHKLFSSRTQEVSGYSKDGKTVVSTSTVQGELPWELTLNAGQLIYSDNVEDAFGGGDFHTDAWLFVGQLVGSYKFTPDFKVTVAPGYMTYTAGNLNSASDAVPLTNANGVIPHAVTRDLSILTAPGDISFKVAGIKVKALWDFAYNFRGQSRDTNELGLSYLKDPVTGDTIVSGHSGADDLAWLAGFVLGENKKAGDWSVLANFRQTGIAAIDPNLNDSDFAASYVNTQGYKVGVAYNLTDFCVGAVTYYNAWNLRKNLIGGEATHDQKIANANQVQVLQVDLSVKF